MKKVKWEAYTDGSWMSADAGYGAVILKNGEVVHKISGRVPHAATLGSRQVAGEIQAVLEVLQYCKENGIEEITIFYDYLGLENWINGTWKAQKKISRDFILDFHGYGVKVHWHKVKAHSGNRYHDMADELAKAAIASAEKHVVSKNKTATEKLTVNALESRGRAWMETLKKNGFSINESKTRIVNGNCFKVALGDEGYINLYLLKDGSFSLKLHEYRGNPKPILELWEQ